MRASDPNLHVDLLALEAIENQLDAIRHRLEGESKAATRRTKKLERLREAATSASREVSECVEMLQAAKTEFAREDQLLKLRRKEHLSLATEVAKLANRPTTFRLLRFVTLSRWRGEHERATRNAYEEAKRQLEETTHTWENSSSSIERLTKQASQAKDKLRQTLTLIERLSADIENRDERARQKYRDLRRRRDPLTVRLADFLPAYQRARSRNGRGIAQVQSGRCANCHTFIHSGLLEQMAEPDRVAPCPGCGCILYLPGALSRPVKSQGEAQELTWEVLPAGWWRDEAFVRRIQAEAAKEGVILDIGRLVKLESLSPKVSYRGCFLDKSTGYRRYPYYVFEFEQVAIADCQELGNALYYASAKEWREVFRLTKRDALRVGAGRLVHRGDWFARARALVTKE
jgi:predicted  nucleic acid-binding Zn-ribbon protein